MFQLTNPSLTQIEFGINQITDHFALERIRYLGCFSFVSVIRNSVNSYFRSYLLKATAAIFLLLYPPCQQNATNQDTKDTERAF